MGNDEGLEQRHGPKHGTIPARFLERAPPLA
jgi:hypothetical protein